LLKENNLVILRTSAKAIKKFGTLNAINTTNFLPEIREEHCNGCGSFWHSISFFIIVGVVHYNGKKLYLRIIERSVRGVIIGLPIELKF